MMKMTPRPHLEEDIGCDTLPEGRDIVPSSGDKNPPSLPPPDQGVAAWMTVLGGFCLLFVSFGWVTCIGLFQNYYQDHQLSAYSPSTVAWIPSLETCLMFLWGPVVGKLHDNFGPRWLLIVGTLMHVFGIMMISISTQYYQIALTQSICSASGASCLFFTGITCVSTWFVRRRALALGITVAGSSLGGIIFPIFVNHLIPKIGFPWTIRCCGFLILVLCIIANLTVRSRLASSRKRVDLTDFWRPLGERTFAAFAVAYFLFYLGFFVPYNFAITEAEQFGMKPELALYLVPILNAGGSIGRIAPGWVADRIGRFNTMIIVTLLSATVVLALWIPGKSNAAIIVFCVLYGFGTGAFITLGPAILAQISPLPELGTRQGTCFAFVAIASLISNPIAGALILNSSSDPFWKLQVFAGVMMMGGAAMVIVARVSARGTRLAVVV